MVGAGAGCVAAAVKQVSAVVVGRRVAAWLVRLAVPVVGMYVYDLRWDVRWSGPPTERQPRQT